MKQLCVIFLFLLVTACNFNKLFLVPTKVPARAKQMTFARGTDTTVVSFSGPTHQPLFIKNGTDTLNSDFTIESVLFVNSNGDTLNGWFLKSKTVTPSITLLHCHGNGGFLVSQYRAMSPLLAQGFQIFLFDYSGFGFSQGKSTRKNVLIDANSALDYLKTRPEIVNTKLVIYGQSLGGHLSAVLAAQREKDVDGLVVEGAFSSHKDIAANMVPVLGRIFVKQGYCAVKSIKEFHKPVLVIHSTEDETIPYTMGQKIFAAANEPKQFYEIKKCHICGPSYYADSIAVKIKAMW
jgi:pimeloyl-ACP methyl ester carboxylesterase